MAIVRQGVTRTGNRTRLTDCFNQFFKVFMDDQGIWANAVATIGEMYAHLPPETRAELDSLINRIMRLKESLAEQTLSAGSAAICRSCGGQCCLNGKYHFSALDLLAYRKTGIEPVEPNFGSNPACPYSDKSGCLMQPGFRPMACVVFNCELIEERMEPNELRKFYENERTLREVIAHAGQIANQRLDRALLLSCNC
jgi:hypothetical protein